MNLNIYYIQKKLDTNEFAAKFAKLIAPRANLAERNLFNKKTASQNRQEAIRAYSEAFLPHQNSGFNIALSEDGKQLSSEQFAKLIENKQTINFFIGGAFGLEEDFKRSCDEVWSLSRLTTTHELARILLLEQLYRALCINSNHPYHK